MYGVNRADEGDDRRGLSLVDSETTTEGSQHGTGEPATS